MTASQTAGPWGVATLSSKASSPENEMRNTRPSTPAMTASRQVMNGKASLRDVEVRGTRAATTSRERGPTTATVDHCSVTLVQRTRSSGHSVWSHSSRWSRTAAALPVVVVMWNRSSASREVTPSSKTIPSGRHISP